MTPDPTTITKTVQVSVNGATPDLPVTPVRAPIHPVNAPARITRTGASPCPRPGKPTDVTQALPVLRAGRDRPGPAPAPDRQTAIPVLSHHGVSIEAIADLAGHANSRMTQTAHRHQPGDNDQHRHHRLGQHQPGEDETG